MRLALTLAERSSGSSVRLPIGVTVVVGGHGRPPEARGALASSGTCWQAWTAHLPRLPASCSSGPRPPWATGVSSRPDDGRSRGRRRPSTPFRDARHDGGPTPGGTALVGHSGLEPGLPSSRRWHPIAG